MDLISIEIEGFISVFLSYFLVLYIPHMNDEGGLKSSSLVSLLIGGVSVILSIANIGVVFGGIVMMIIVFYMLTSLFKYSLASALISVLFAGVLSQILSANLHNLL